MDKNNTQEQLKNAIMDFVTGYGLLGFITALPTTPDFITYYAVYLPKNHFIKEESMTIEKYLSYFFHFYKIDFVKKGMESSWSTDDVQMMFFFMLTDEKSTLKVCKHCGKAFVAGRPNSVFCSGKCKNRYNVYKSRAKDKTQTIPTNYYNLDAIISVGYRVNSIQATRFRIWATGILKEYMIKGFAMDDERMKQGKTAAEIVYNQAGHTKENMGLTTWKNAPDGRISHKQAVEKAYQEYDIFNKTQPIESDFDKVVKGLAKKI